MEKPKPEVFEKLKGEHPDREIIQIKHVVEYSGEVIYAAAKVPNRHEWAKFTRILSDSDKKSQAVESMVRDSVVYPPPVDFDALLHRLPGLVATLGNTLTKAAGASSEAEVGNW